MPRGTPNPVKKMNDMALKIWQGQSPDLPMIERVGRIKNALEYHGYAEHLGKLDLPGQEWKRYL